jgi:hypothetical protein
MDIQVTNTTFRENRQTYIDQTIQPRQPQQSTTGGYRSMTVAWCHRTKRATEAIRAIPLLDWHVAMVLCTDDDGFQVEPHSVNLPQHWYFVCAGNDLCVNRVGTASNVTMYCHPQLHWPQWPLREAVRIVEEVLLQEEQGGCCCGSVVH